VPEAIDAQLRPAAIVLLPSRERFAQRLEPPLGGRRNIKNTTSIPMASRNAAVHGSQRGSGFIESHGMLLQVSPVSVLSVYRRSAGGSLPAHRSATFSPCRKMHSCAPPRSSAWAAANAAFTPSNPCLTVPKAAPTHTRQIFALATMSLAAPRRNASESPHDSRLACRNGANRYI